VSGRGTVYAVTVVHRPPQAAFAAIAPYAYALVDLDEGIRVITIITGCPPDQVAVGMRVGAFIDRPGADDQAATPLIWYVPLDTEGTGPGRTVEDTVR
jgi:uncharacterized OB-fold protein